MAAEDHGWLAAAGVPVAVHDHRWEVLLQCRAPARREVAQVVATISQLIVRATVRANRWASCPRLDHVPVAAISQAIDLTLVNVLAQETLLPIDRMLEIGRMAVV